MSSPDPLDDPNYVSLEADLSHAWAGLPADASREDIEKMVFTFSRAAYGRGYSEAFESGARKT